MVRGRPRKTDPQEALKAIMITFWQKGYDATSLSDLVKASGMAKPGLYATFGDKQEIYKQALDYYVGYQRNQHFAEIMRADIDAKEIFGNFLHKLKDTMLDSDVPDGCLLVNTLMKSQNNEPSLKKLAQKYNTLRRQGFYGCLERAQNDGRLSCKKDLDTLADYLSAQVLTLAVLHKTGADQKELSQFIDTVLMIFED